MNTKIQKESEDRINLILSFAESELSIIEKHRHSRLKEGILFFMVGVIIAFIPFFVMLYFDIATYYFWYSLSIFFVGLLVILQGTKLIMSVKELNKLGSGDYKVYSLVTCTNPKCDFREERSWKKGDYIGKKLHEKCPKCMSELQIVGIYGEAERPLKSLPILPGMGQFYNNRFSRLRRILNILS